MVARVKPTGTPVVYGTVESTGISIAKPVEAGEWRNAASLANYLQGHGGTIIAANTDYLTFDDDLHEWRYYIWPRYNTVMRLWVISLKGAARLSYGGNLAVDSVSVSTFVGNLGEFGQNTHYLFQSVTQSLASTPILVEIGVSGTQAGEFLIQLAELAAYDVPRVMLASDSDELGAEQDTCRAGDLIYDPPVGTPMKSITGAKYGVYVAKDVAKRNSVFHWYDEDGVYVNNADWAPLFQLNPEALGRLLKSTDGDGATNGRSLCWTIYADGWTDSQVRITTASGNISTLTMVEGGPAWQTPIYFDVDCEDLTSADGRRDTTWEELTIEVKKGESAWTIYGLSIGEEDEP